MDFDLDSSGLAAITSTWTWTTLGSVGFWGSGSTPPRGEERFYGGENNWLKSGELNDNKELRGSEERVTQAAIQKCSFRQNKTGDVLLAMYGATEGKIAILAEPAVTNQGVCGCPRSEGVLNRFLYYYIISKRESCRNDREGGA